MSDPTNEVMSQAETAFAIESASSAAVKALSEVAPKEIMRMAWLLGYVTGRRDAFAIAHGMIGTSDKAVSTGPGDLDVCGRELRPGS